MILKNYFFENSLIQNKQSVTRIIIENTIQQVITAKDNIWLTVAVPAKITIGNNSITRGIVSSNTINEIADKNNNANPVIVFLIKCYPFISVLLNKSFKNVCF